MKNKITKIFALMLVLVTGAIVTMAFVGCDDPNAVRYDYEKASCEIASGDIDIPDTITPTYNAMYKDSYVKVSDGKVVWVISDVESEMKITKDGNKDMFSGEYTEKFKESFNMTGMTISKYEMYGEKTDDGYNIVMELTMKTYGYEVAVKATLIFKQA